MGKKLSALIEETTTVLDKTSENLKKQKQKIDDLEKERKKEQELTEKERKEL